MSLQDKKPELKVNLDGEEHDLEFLIGCVRFTGEDDEAGRTLICGELDENDILNALRFMARDVVRVLHQFVPTDELLEAVNRCVTDGMSEGFGGTFSESDSLN